MGSRSTQASRRERLTAAGLEARADSSVCPGRLGWTSVAVRASETALSILAEAVALRHGRDGGRLTVAEQAIHAGGRP